MPRKRRRHHRPRQRQRERDRGIRNRRKVSSFFFYSFFVFGGRKARRMQLERRKHRPPPRRRRREVRKGNDFDRSFVRGRALVSKAKEKSVRVLESAIGSRALASRLLGSKRENATVSTTVFLYSRGRVLESVFTKPKLSIEDLQFTQMGRVKLQKHRQSIAYPKFCLDLIEERIDEVYVNVIGQIARYYAIYPDGRLAVCQVPT